MIAIPSLRSSAFRGPSVTTISSVVESWASRVVTNGGAAPSTNTKNALSTFYNGLVSNNLLVKMKAVCCFVPDNLIACTTPLINSGSIGLDPWTNLGNKFVAGDLTIDGLKGNASDKALNTGITPDEMYANTSDGGGTLYISSGSTTSANDWGMAWSGGSGFFCYYHQFFGQSYFDCYAQSGAGRVTAVNSTLTGYTSCNRIGNYHVIYKANSSVAHQVVADANDGVAGSLITYPILLFCRGIDGPNIQSPCDRRFSFFALHNGLTLGESQAFYPLIQTLRTNLGGGYV